VAYKSDGPSQGPSRQPTYTTYITMGVLPWSKCNAQRKFLDLINEATFKWANWDPPKVLQVSRRPPFIAVHHSELGIITADRRFWYHRQENWRVESRREYIYTPGGQTYRAGIPRVRGCRDRSVPDPLSASEEAGCKRRCRLVSLQLDVSYRMRRRAHHIVSVLPKTRVSPSGADGNSTPSVVRSC
jgi:hypothetical protein